jgi:hypothetical protein
MSKSPGSSALPVASITCAPCGICTLPSGPTAWMRLPLTTTVVPGRVRPVSASNRLALRKTTGPDGRCASVLPICAPHAVSASWSARNSAGSAASHPSGTSAIQSLPAAKNSWFSSSHRR